MHRFTPHPEGVELRLELEEIEALTMIPDMLNSVGEIAEDPAVERLTVSAYPDDEAADSEYAPWLADELEAGRAADRSTVTTSLEVARTDPVVLSMGEAEAWLLVLNEARLALAARLGITEEGWGDEQDLEELAPPLAFLQYLTYLHGELTGVLLEKL